MGNREKVAFIGFLKATFDGEQRESGVYRVSQSHF